MKLKFETTVKERDKTLLDFITIDLLKVGHKYPSGQDIITLTMTPIINIFSIKKIMSWELIHRCLLHPSDSGIKEIFRHQTLTCLPKIVLRN